MNSKFFFLYFILFYFILDYFVFTDEDDDIRACQWEEGKTAHVCTVFGQNTIVYDRVRENTVAYDLRISPYTITAIYDRNTITCITAKYGRIRSVYGMYTVVYDTVYDRLRPYTESVTVDLGRY